jgi:TRAP-type mannitol/chloroaromatic compound transport system permease large subunit
MTVHSAKGLEFDAVFITGIEEGLFPHEQSLSDADGVEEERRLMYVAITRARQRPYLSFSQTRMLHGQTRYNVKSRFIDELPEEALKWITPKQQGFGSGLAREHQQAWQRGSGLGGIAGAGRVEPAPRASAPAITPREAPGGLRVGQSVFHGKFGEGVVLTLEGLDGDPSFEPPTDERIVMSLMVGIGFAWVVAVLDKLLRINALSTLARQVTFVLIPPLLLVFLVLGTVFLGLATPTEGGAMGATGALLMALARKRLPGTLLRQALDSSARLSIFVIFVLIGSTIFALTFQAIDGPVWVKALFAALPGGELGFLLFVDALIFILCCFIDFFEIAFILLPVLKEMEINLVWFGVMVALNLQTSFLTPPFGFALFYLRSVAPKADYVDKVTSRHITAIKTGDIYKGAVAFVALQLIMVAAVLWKPQIVLYGLGEQKVLDVDKVNLNITPMEEEEEPPPSFGDLPPAMPPAPAAPTN